MNVIEYLKSKQLKPYEKGFGYWVTAINFYKEYEKKEHMPPISAYMIYHQLSKHYNISQSTICQSMRKTLRNANIKLSCMQFIRMFLQILFMGFQIKLWKNLKLILAKAMHQGREKPLMAIQKLVDIQYLQTQQD